MRSSLYIIYVLLFILSNKGVAQNGEVVLGAGIAYYLGDLNAKNEAKGFINELTDGSTYNYMFSLGYRHQLAQYWSMGITGNLLRLSGDDANNKSKAMYDAEWYRLGRNLSFYTQVYQLNIDINYEPLRNEERWESGKWLFSPFVGIGIGGFKFNPKTIYNGQEIELQPLGTEGQGLTGYPTKYSTISLCIPASLGIRFIAPNRKFALSWKNTLNYTFTDYIDDVSGVYPNYQLIQNQYDPTIASLIIALSNRSLFDSNHQYIVAAGEQRGDPKDNDQFIVSQITISYFLGQAKPVRRKDYGCFYF